LKATLIGFAGLSGAGKSTAAQYLVRRGFGTYYYAGDVLSKAITERGLEQNPDNERMVRQVLRTDHGMAIFAEKALSHLGERCSREIILLDAIYCPEEHEFYSAALGDRLKVIAISTSFDIRAARLQNRTCRPMPTEKLFERDKLELERLRMGELLTAPRTGG
jgi:dephospho-CoA kinase